MFETGSFTMAAQRLMMTKATISKRVTALEGSLGIQLITRNTRNVNFTSAGRTFYSAAKRILTDYNNAVAEMKKEIDEAEGVIRLGGPLSFGRLCLAPALIDFMKEHPKIHVQLVLSDKFSNVVSEGLDLVIRLGEMRDSSLSGRALCKKSRLICASPAYIKVYGNINHPEELIKHRILQYSGLQTGGNWPLMVNGGVELFEVNDSFCADNGEILAEAAAAGDGIVMLPEFILRPYIASGRLTPILENWPPLDLNLHLLWPKHAPISHRLRLLIDHLAGYFSTN